MQDDDLAPTPLTAPREVDDPALFPCLSEAMGATTSVNNRTGIVVTLNILALQNAINELLGVLSHTIPVRSRPLLIVRNHALIKVISELPFGFVQAPSL
jgi:hypothetical protein